MITIPKLSKNIKIIFDILEIRIFFTDDMDYLDISKDGEYITYIRKDRVNGLINSGVDPWEVKNKDLIKVGRFFNMYLDKGQKYIESIVTKIKTEIRWLNGIFDEFNTVSGLKIYKYYKTKNYENLYGGIYSSCMVNKLFARYLLYILNPQVCKMLVLKGKNGKIKGRALLWKTNKGSYMDRVYVSDHKDIDLFKRYAEVNNIINYEEKVKLNPYSYVVRNNYTGVEVKLRPLFRFLYFNLPYLDSFVFKKNKLYLR
ncbi:MAG: hypothetical protein KDH96_10195 [Candidatus Riesia sp.]|nr:hypothetical protein [Candidatus Riesia sp.]